MEGTEQTEVDVLRGGSAGEVQQKPRIIVGLNPYSRNFIRCQGDKGRYDLYFSCGKLEEVIHTEKVKV